MLLKRNWYSERGGGSETMNRCSDSLTTHPVRGHQLEDFQEEVAIAHPQHLGKTKQRYKVNYIRIDL